MPNSSSNRSASVVRGIFTSLFARTLYVLAPLVTIPLALQQLGVSGYGAWSAALALTAITSFADLGLGVGLMTRLAEALTGRDYRRAKILVASAYCFVGTIVLLLVAALWLSTLWIDWARVIGGQGSTDGSIVVVTLSVFLANIIASLIVRVQYAAQEVARSNIWQSAASLVGIGGVIVAVALDVSSSMFVLMAGLGLPIVMLINTWWFFARGAGRYFRPSLKEFNWAESRALVALGSRFLVISMLISLTLSIDPLVVSHAAGLDAAAEYAIPAKIFAMLSTVTSALSIPLWTANVDALRLGDRAWLQRITLRMTLLSGGAVAICGVIGALAAPWVIAIWLDGTIAPSHLLLWGLAAVSTVQAIAAPMFMVQNAAEALRPQMIGYALLLTTLPVKWLVAIEYGPAWIPWITVAGYCLLIWPAAMWGYHQAMRGAELKGART